MSCPVEESLPVLHERSPSSGKGVRNRMSRSLLCHQATVTALSLTPGPLIPRNTHCTRKAEVPGNPDPQPPPANPLRPVLSKDGFRETGAGPESYGRIWQLLASTLVPITPNK